ncbi:SufD family Fe-S cluster assembly protein [Patescibacteria group bacterium]|nr:SufD family Fe-S cluster assembly protein [Patescibacteria group bacterium]
MKNVKNANFWQIDHNIKNALGGQGVVVLPSSTAWEKYKWSRKWFTEKPKQGYFVWVKKQVNFPLTTCITIASPKISQNLINLLVIEKGIKAKANVVCNAAKNNLYGTHKAQGRLILKEGSSLEYNHFHQWGKNDFVNPDYEFIIGENSSLIYNYKNLLPPKDLQLKTTIYNAKNASSNLNFVINGLNSKIDLKDTLFLEGKDARGIINLRLVGRENSQIKAHTTIFAKAPGKGHLDCQGLLVNKSSKISLAPELICENKEAQITHEASIGKISQEQLTYLRMRGLTEKEAIDLIVAGFLKI